jgi:FkbM family methyltransferase
MQLTSMIVGVGTHRREIFIRRHSTDRSLVGQILQYGAFDLARLSRFPDIMAFLNEARKTGRSPLIVDAGANIGLASIYFAIQCPDAAIVAIEPEPLNFAMLLANVSGLAVTPVAGALASIPQRMAIVDPDRGEWGYQTRPARSGDGDQVVVDSVTIEQIYAERDASCFPFLVKIDIEGGEAEVFAGNLDWIDRTPILIVEPHDWMRPKQGVARPFLRAIADKDRDFLIVGEHIFSIANDLPRLVASRQMAG